MSIKTFWEWFDMSIDGNSSIYDMQDVSEYEVMSCVDYIYETQFFEDGVEDWNIQQWETFWFQECAKRAQERNDREWGIRQVQVFLRLRRMYLDYVESKGGRTSGNNKKAKVRPSRSIPLGVRWQVLERDHRKCRACGASPAMDVSVKLHVDHIIPVSKGGTSEPENLQVLCADCNIGKSNRMPQ